MKKIICENIGKPSVEVLESAREDLKLKFNKAITKELINKISENDENSTDVEFITSGLSAEQLAEKIIRESGIDKELNKTFGRYIMGIDPYEPKSCGSHLDPQEYTMVLTSKPKNA